MKIAVVNNYDSFVYNLTQLLDRIEGVCYDVMLNDEDRLLERLTEYDKILISPGGGLPCEAGKLMEVIDIYHQSHHMLGVCLGHQAIAQYFGAELRNLDSPLHGHPAKLHITDSRDQLLTTISDGSTVGLYHSWDVGSQSLPACLHASSIDQRGVIMSIYHHSLPIHGVQFHPESIISDCGEELIRRWIAI